MRRSREENSEDEDSTKPRGVRWYEYQARCTIHLFHWRVWHWLIRGFPEWEIRDLDVPNAKPLRAIDLPEILDTLRSTVRQHTGSQVELHVTCALRLICDEVLTKEHFDSVRVTSDAIYFDKVNIALEGKSPILIDITVPRPSDCTVDDRALSQPPTALAA